MELKPNCGSDRAWVYSVPADYADEEIRPELLAIKFANPES
jgi:Ran-binding protein 1